MADDYKENSITLPGAIAIGTGVMIGAGILALTGLIAGLPRYQASAVPAVSYPASAPVALRDQLAGAAPLRGHLHSL